MNSHTKAARLALIEKFVSRKNKTNKENGIMSNANLVMETVTLNISEIERNPDQVRKVFDEKKLQELAADIKQNGLINPVVVKRNPAGSKVPYMLNSGERRYRALTINKMDVVTARIIPAGKTELDLDILQFVDNVDREDLTTFEQAAWMARLVDKHKLSGADVAKRVGKNVSYVNRLLAPYTKLNPKILKDWEDGHELATVATLGQLVAKFDKDEQLNAWANLKEFGSFAAPEEQSDDEESEEAAGGEKDDKPQAFRVKSAQTLERFGIVMRQINGEDKYNGTFVQALLKFVIGKRAMPPEGIELPAKEKKAAPRSVRKSGSTEATA